MQAILGAPRTQVSDKIYSKLENTINTSINAYKKIEVLVIKLYNNQFNDKN
jgi:hypothetical protein